MLQLSRGGLSTFRHLTKNRINPVYICKNTATRVVSFFKMTSKKVIENQRNIINSINSSNQFDILSDFVTPHWKISYEEELGIKQKLCEDIVNSLLCKLSSKKDAKTYVKKIIGSPVRNAYRHRDEFSVWPGLDGDPKTVGFFVGSPAVGKVYCIPATYLKCIKDSHKEIAQLYQDFIKLSPLRVSYQLYDGGFWRNIIVSSNDAGDHMALVITNPTNYTQEFIAEQEKNLQEYFSEKAPSLSLFHQSCHHVKCTRKQAPIHHLSGQEYLLETLCNHTFRISPDSFFQQNKIAAEIMFEEVLKMTKPKPFTSLLDLYCGTGAISILASGLVRGTVGVDEADAAVEDAVYNAEFNNATNCKFIAGKVELKLDSVLKNLEYSPHIVAVVNPGRGGANESVISLLRKNPHIERLIYISCKPDNDMTMRNFVQLCENFSPGYKPFYLTKALPIDIFPYTSHCELVLCFNKR